MDNEKDLENVNETPAGDAPAEETAAEEIAAEETSAEAVSEDTSTEEAEENAAEDENAVLEETEAAEEASPAYSTADYSYIPPEAPASQKKLSGGKIAAIVVAVVAVVAIAAVAGKLIWDNVQLNRHYQTFLDANGNVQMAYLTTDDNGAEYYETRTLSSMAQEMGLTNEEFIEKFGNPYNNQGYVDTSGRTLEEVVASFNEGVEESQMITLADFLSEYDLPDDMPADTIEAAAFYTMPVSTYAAMYGMDTELLRTIFTSFPAAADDSTPWGVVEGELTLADYVGEDYLEDFKAEYGFGDEVTIDTKYKDVRATIDNLIKQEREAEEAAAANATATPEATAEVTADPAAATADPAAATADPAAAATEAPAATAAAQ